MDALAPRFGQVRAEITAACQACGRDPAGVTLVAVSKLHPARAVVAAAALGQRDFGENYAQELRDKAAALAGTPLRWHFIGALQRNKARLVVGTAALVHTVDSAALVGALAQEARRRGLTQDCLVEVNLAGEAQKGGCAPGELGAVLDAVAAAGGALRCLGLMCIPPAAPRAEDSRPHFRRLRGLLEEARAVPRPHVDLRELSMGMSQDFAVAIAEGATLVRIGTALFGERPPRQGP